MTINCAWLGDATETTATYVVRSDANGALTMAVGGSTFTGTTIDTAVNDGIGTVVATGLAPGKEYACSLSVGGAATIIRKIKTMPANAPFKVAFMSCFNNFGSIEPLSQALIAEAVSAVFHQGDYIYVATAYAGFGETSAVPVTGSATSVYATHFRQQHRNPGTELIESYCPQYYQGDDHELGGDNWDHSVTQAQAGGCNVASGGTQAQVDASWWSGQQAMIAYYLGNPANGDSGISASTDKPSSAGAGTPASQYFPKYFRKIIGNAEFFVIDCISYRSPTAATDNASKTMLGATQKQWLKDRLAASTATFKIIVSSKNVYPNDTTLDGWEVFTTERAELLTYIRDTVTTKGVFWVYGDSHQAHASYNEALQFTGFCANPAGVVRITSSVAYGANVVWRETGTAGGVPGGTVGAHGDCNPIAGVLTINPDYVEMRFIDPLGRTLQDPQGKVAQWRVMAGSNLMVQSA